MQAKVTIQTCKSDAATNLYTTTDYFNLLCNAIFYATHVANDNTTGA